MSTADWRLNLLTFPQRWDGPAGQLHLKVAVLPRVNPLEALRPGTPPDLDEPAFVNANLSLHAMLIPSLERLPDPADVTAYRTLGITSPADLKDLYEELATQFPLHPPGTPTPKPEPRRKDTYMKKFLPGSYQRAFAFEYPRTQFAYVDDTYHCALKTQPTKPPAPAPTSMSWGQVIAVVLQQPRLAERLGLVYTDVITLPSNTFFEEGGWLYIALAPDSDYVSLAPPSSDQVKYYAARLPALKAGETRPLFAAVLFPVLSGPPPASYDENFLEAEAYDDGFAKVVHCDQPTTADLLADSKDALPPVRDAGIALGWDDEQLTIWMNRQIDPASAAQDSPMAVLGYRVDVRKIGTQEWTSLARVQGQLRLGLLLNEHFIGEHSLRVAPVQLHSQRIGDYWLPSYFARWTGKSLVTNDGVAMHLRNDPAVEPVWKAVGLDRVSLKYGETYQFRVRLSDIAGGGPKVKEKPQNPAAAPIATRLFRRFVPPKTVQLAGPVAPADPDDPPTTYQIVRPLLGYPTLVFTQLPDAEAKLLADAPIAKAEGREIGFPDPDVTTLEIVVEVRDRPIDDTSAFRTMYVATRDFPDDLNDPLSLELDFQDEKDIATLPLPSASGPLIIPTARDIRLSLTPICRADPTLKYFGAQEVRRGRTLHISTHGHSSKERDLFVPQTPGKRLQAIMLQPDPTPGRHQAVVQAAAGDQQEAPSDLVQRLAQQLRLEVDGLTFFGRAGRRVVFGCSAGVSHVLSPDYSSITFASKSDLIRQWIPVIHLQLDRDWTWDALADVSFEITREIKGTLTEVGKEVVGTIEVRRSISPSARRNADMTQTDLLFFDAIDPKPEPTAFPTELDVHYTIRTFFKNAPEADDPLQLEILLPMAFPPVQTPKLASAGIALSPYQRADDYSATAPRQRMLWLEFEDPVENKGRDAYFVRVLAYAPDPMLTDVSPAEPPVPLEPPLPVDPGLIRVITPKQSDDRAGLDDMQPLIPSESPVHFLVPLPHGVSEVSPELFGFFVYEIRVGHLEGWSTAQDRFGPPLRVTGVQHPAPSLVCQVARGRPGISATAGYATPVAEGRNLLPLSPNTEIWGLLYAQVTQIDNADRRNVLLGRRSFHMERRNDLRETFDAAAVGHWDQSEIEALLSGLALPKDSPLSVLAVELLTQIYPKGDPLGGDLGHVRILRTSPLVPVPPVCT